ncbi:Uncharacterised protein r2_g873 [Pycnogonum litorale]
MKKETIGIILGVFDGVFTGFNHFLSSVLTEFSTFSPITILWQTNVIYFAISMVAAVNYKIFSEIKYSELVFLLSRCITAYIARISVVYAFVFIPVYSVDMVRCSDSIIVLFLGCCILKVKVTWPILASSILNIAGIVMIYRPTFLTSPGYQVNHWHRFFGIILSLISATSAAIYKLLGRNMKKTDYRIATLFESGTMVVLNTVLVYSLGVAQVPVTLRDCLMVAGAGISYFIAICFIFFAFKLGPVANVAFASMSFLPTTLISKSTLDNKFPTLYDLIGMTCVVIGIVFCLFSENLIIFCEDSMEKFRKNCIGCLSGKCNRNASNYQDDSCTDSLIKHTPD